MGIDMPAQIYQADYEINSKLRDIGLTKEGLLSTVKASVAEVRSCTGHSPPISRGWLAWYTAVVRLRQEFCSGGWEQDDTANFSTIVDRSSGVRIAVANTDSATGDPSEFPTNRSRKGELNRQAVQDNQLNLPFRDSEFSTVVESDNLNTWYLCIFITNDEVRAELSLPTSCEVGYFTDWKERIILISSDDDWSISIVPEDDTGPEFEVVVKRK